MIFYPKGISFFYKVLISYSPIILLEYFFFQCH